jgi:sec-independent protein translocase protein TatB
VFGVNLGEFGVIVLIALIVVGPERLPRYAQQLGRMVREGRRMAMGLREQVREELGPEFDEVDWRKLDPRQYDPRRIIRDALTEEWDATTPEPSGATAASRVAEDAEDDAPDERRPTTAGATGARDVAYDDEAT